MIFGFLMMMALLPVALMVGCGNSSSPSSPVGPTTTYTPAPYTTPQTTPQAGVVLNTSANYVLLSYTGITNSGPTTTCGGYGVYPNGPSFVTGSPAIVESCGGPIDEGDAAANTAKTDLGNAYTNAQGRSGGATLPPGADIGGQTLYPGLYIETGNLNISSADLTLNGQGNANSIFVFKVASNLVVGSARQVILTNGAQAANVFWAVAGYCSVNTTASMKGDIMAYTSVTFNTGAVLTGRALAENGNVTLLSNTITHP